MHVHFISFNRRVNNSTTLRRRKRQHHPKRAEEGSTTPRRLGKQYQQKKREMERHHRRRGNRTTPIAKTETMQHHPHEGGVQLSLGGAAFSFSFRVVLFLSSSSSGVVPFLFPSSPPLSLSLSLNLPPWGCFFPFSFGWCYFEILSVGGAAVPLFLLWSDAALPHQVVLPSLLHWGVAAWFPSLQEWWCFLPSSLSLLPFSPLPLPHLWAWLGTSSRRQLARQPPANGNVA